MNAINKDSNSLLTRHYGLENSKYLYEKYSEIVDNFDLVYDKEIYNKDFESNITISQNKIENKFKKQITHSILKNQKQVISDESTKYEDSIHDYKYLFENDNVTYKAELNQKLQQIFLETLFGGDRSENDNFYITISKIMMSHKGLSKVTEKILENYQDSNSIDYLLSKAIVKQNSNYTDEKNILYKYILNNKNIDDNKKKELIFIRTFESGNIEEFSKFVENYKEIYSKGKKNQQIKEYVSKQELDKLKLLEKMFTNKDADSNIVNKCVEKLDNVNNYIKNIQLNLDIANRYLWNDTLFNPNKQKAEEITLDGDTNGVKEITLNGQKFNIMCHIFNKEDCKKTAEFYANYNDTEKSILNIYDNPEYFSTANAILSTSLISDEYLKHFTPVASEKSINNLYSVEDQAVEDSNNYGLGFCNIPIENYASFCSEDAFSIKGSYNVENICKDVKGLITPKQIITESQEKDSINEIVLIRETDSGVVKPDYIIYFSDGPVNRNLESYKEVYNLAKRTEWPIVVIDERKYIKEKSKDIEVERF